MKEKTIKREVRTDDDITMEILNLKDEAIVTIINRKSKEETEIELRHIKGAEELNEYRAKHYWKEGAVLDKEEIEVKYNEASMTPIPRDRDVTVTRKGSEINILSEWLKSGESSPEENTILSESRCMIKFDENDGIVLKNLENGKIKYLNIPRGIFPLKKVIVEKSNILKDIRERFAGFAELQNVNTDGFLFNVFFKEMVKSFMNTYREPAKNVSTLIDIEKKENMITIKPLAKYNLFNLNIISKGEEKVINICVIDNPRLYLSLNKIGKEALLDTIRAFMAYINLGLDYIDIELLKELGLFENCSEDNKYIDIKEYINYADDTEELLLDNVKSSL